MALISIIIPIYKVEKYLCRCLDSVVNQTFTDFEVILVDDCSPDKCPPICDAYAEKDSRFRVIHKAVNEGLPKARKSGLDIACAEFVMHLDSDDWLEHDALELLIKKQQETNADIVMGSLRELWPAGVKIFNCPEINEQTNILKFYFLNNCKVIWAKIYRKILFDDYIVPDQSIGEDIIVTVQLFSRIRTGKLQKIDEVIYNYDRSTNGMALQTNKKADYNEYIDDQQFNCCIWIEKYLDKLKVDNTINSAFNCFMINAGISHYLRFAKNIKRKDINFFYEKYYKNCFNKNKINIAKRVMLPLFHFSIYLGKAYIAVLNTLFIVRRTGFKNLFLAK